MLRLVRSSKVLTEVCLQGAGIRTGDVLLLKPGQVLMLPRSIDAPLDVLLNGKFMLRGQMVSDGRSLSLQIEARCR